MDDKKEVELVKNSGTVITEIHDSPDAMPQDLRDKAGCVVVLPSAGKFAIGIGGSYDRGAETGRSGKNFVGCGARAKRSTLPLWNTLPTTTHTALPA